MTLTPVIMRDARRHLERPSCVTDAHLKRDGHCFGFVEETDDAGAVDVLVAAVGPAGENSSTKHLRWRMKIPWFLFFTTQTEAFVY